MARELRGAPIARELTAELAVRARRLREAGTVPRLVIIRAGESPDDLSYERAAQKRAEKVGVDASVRAFPTTVATDELLGEIERVNGDPLVDGCLVLRPLPAGVDERAVSRSLATEKDVDGMTPGSLATVFSGDGDGFAPCTAEAVIEILVRSGIRLSGARVAVVGRSLVIGRPVAALLTAQDATVTLCHTKTRELERACRESDVVVACAGAPRVIRADSVSPGQIVVDVGINWDAAEGRLVGDVAFDEVEPIVDAITPVPGGVGSVTTAILMKHVVEAAERRASSTRSWMP